MGAGLGGGSSNGAGFLWALNKLEEWNLPSLELAKQSLPFGADIPFFFHGPTALIQGIGEKATPVETKNYSFILINPNIHCSTGTVFRHFDKQPNIPKASKTPQALIDHHLGPNDLLPVVCDLYPEIKRFYHAVKEQYPALTMSGSGSTFFIPFAGSDPLQPIVETLTQQFPNYWIKAVHSAKETIKENV